MMQVEVLDDDREQRPELVGGMRLSREQLTKAYRSASKLLVQDGNIFISAIWMSSSVYMIATEPFH